MTTGFSTLLALASAPLGRTALDGAGLLGLATTAALVSVACVTIVAGTRIGDIPFTAPCRCASVPLSFVPGFVIRGQVPDAFVLAGAAIAGLAGLGVLQRGRRR